MADRLDVRRMLLRRGWVEDPALPLVLRKGGAVWAVMVGAGDSLLDVPGRRGREGATFSAGVPARVIVAACEAATDAHVIKSGPS